MAIINKGNPLTAALLQPGYSLVSDGFGLVTCSASYKLDSTVASAITVRGTGFPVTGLTYLKAHKSSQSFDALKVMTLKVDYVGIDPTINSGQVTQPNCTSANGLTAQNITTHPNFFTVKTGYLGPIAGEAPYTQDVPNNFAPNVGGVPAYLGLNGACFEKENGGRFIGFVNPTFPQYYGKTQYLAPTTSYSGVVYVDDIASVQVLVALNGTSSLTRAWSTFSLLPLWAPIGAGLYGNPVNLLSQVNVEEFGSLFKINYEIRYNSEGWEIDVYEKL
jgi:hypothetical protein